MTSLQALIGFTAWTLLLVLIVFSWRGIAILLQGRKADSWTRGKQVDDPGFVRRVEHAHANALENLPLFAVIVLVAQAMGKSAVTDAWAMYVLYARVAQSLVHMIGVNHWLVMLRATFWSAQLVLFIIMLLGLCGGHAA
ncbi:MAG TPA: MAPEG family protein [Nevskia sp.]|jgi:uncharacterized MAPEG superfamily protein|nr:MAPEG family protein [Nevskia sp.]